MKSGRDEAARGSIPGSSPRPDREHRKPQPTTCYTVVCVKTAVEISEESRLAVVDFRRDRRPDPATMRRLARKLRPYRFAYRRFRPIFMPIRNMLQKETTLFRDCAR